MKPFAFLLTMGVFALPTLPALAQETDNRFAGGSCHQGICTATYLLDRQVIHQNQLYGGSNTLYEISVELLSKQRLGCCLRV
jgi:hypothetical protein